MSIFFKGAASAALMCCAQVAAASPVTIDFDVTFAIVSSYDEDGFGVSPNFGTLSVGLPSFDQLGMRPRFAGQLITIAKLDGSPFALNSMDVAVNSDNQTIDIIGNLLGGGQVVQTIAPPPLDYQTFSFGANFTGLTSIQFAQGPSISGDDDFSFDNIVLTVEDTGTGVVPLPASMALLAAGLIPLGLLRRRKARAARR